MRRLASLAGLALLFVSRAWAQTSLPLELDWHAPAECASSAAVRDELSRITRVPAGTTLQPLFARVDVQRSGAAYAAVLRTEHEGRSGERRLEADSCPTLIRSVTLVLALAFGPGVELSEPLDRDSAPPPAASSKESEPSGSTGEPVASTIEPSNAARSAVQDGESSPAADTEADDDIPERRWNLWLTGGAQFGMLPTTAFVTSLGVDTETPHSWLGARAQFWPGVSDDLRTDRGGQFEAQYAALGLALRACLVAARSPVTLALCGTFGVAAIRGKVTDAARVDGQASIAPWYTSELAAAVDWPRASRVRMRLEANVTTSLNRPRFIVEGVGSAHRVGAFVPLLAAGVVLTL